MRHRPRRGVIQRHEPAPVPPRRLPDPFRKAETVRLDPVERGQCHRAECGNDLWADDLEPPGQPAHTSPGFGRPRAAVSTLPISRMTQYRVRPVDEFRRDTRQRQQAVNRLPRTISSERYTRPDSAEAARRLGDQDDRGWHRPVARPGDGPAQTRTGPAGGHLGQQACPGVARRRCESLFRPDRDRALPGAGRDGHSHA